MMNNNYPDVSVRPIVVFGNGHLAQEVISYMFTHKSYLVHGVISSTKKDLGKRILDNVEVIARDGEYRRMGVAGVIAVGDPKLRKKILEKNDQITHWATLTFTNSIGYGNVIGEGSVVTPGCVLTTGINIGKHCYINILSSIGHNVQIGDFSVISPHACISGEVIIEDLVMVGSGAVILPGIRIGSGAIVGAGAIVTHDVEPGITVVGNPARKLNKLSQKEPGNV